MGIKELYRLIDDTNRNENVCDDVLEVLYHKHGRVPKRRDLSKEIEFLKSQSELKEVDKMFLQLLITAIVWFYKVPFGEYLELWTLERHIPYEKARV